MSIGPASGIPAIDQALLPAGVRSGSPAAQKAYDAALGFEQILVNELSQELAASAPDGGGSDGTTDAASGLMGSDPANSTYAQLLPQALSSSVMSAGGLGVAPELATSIDPSIGALQ